MKIPLCSLLTLSALFGAALLHADVKPAAIFDDHMVIQHDREIPVWGVAAPGEKVKVAFAGQSGSCVADADGKWEVRLTPLAVSKTGSDLVVSGVNTVVIKDVVVGDVWLCGGQSNMEWFIAKGVLDGERFIAEAEKFPLIRQIKVDRRMSETPAADIVPAPRWSACSSENIKNSYFTATGYFFARAVHRATGVPFGIVNLGWNGQHIDPFIPNSAAKSAGLKPQPKTAWNAMIAPITRFPVKGAIWYQGCSNAGDRLNYFGKLKTLIEGWRGAFGKDLPFYVVQLAAYGKINDDAAGGEGHTMVREAQRRILALPHTGLACAIDIGSSEDVHPRNKYDVGERLARWALHDVYGFKDIIVSGPLYRSMSVSDGKVRLEFDYADGLMTASKSGLEAPKPTPKDAPCEFSIAGADGKWFRATAVIDGKSVIVSAPEVKAPTAVRYAYRGFPVNPNLYNAAGLPMVPFTTEK